MYRMYLVLLIGDAFPILAATAVVPALRTFSLPCSQFFESLIPSIVIVIPRLSSACGFLYLSPSYV